MNVKAGEKLNKGLSKLKQGVLGRSMEGIIDTPTDTALDIADIVTNTEDDEDSEYFDETLTTGSAGSAGFGNILEYRDLSAWRIQIPAIQHFSDPNGKKYFTFVIEVQRIGEYTGCIFLNDLLDVFESFSLLFHKLIK